MILRIRNFYTDLKFISFYKKHVKSEIENVVSYMRDTTVAYWADRVETFSFPWSPAQLKHISLYLTVAGECQIKLIKFYQLCQFINWVYWQISMFETVITFLSLLILMKLCYRYIVWLSTISYTIYECEILWYISEETDVYFFRTWCCII